MRAKTKAAFLKSVPVQKYQIMRENSTQFCNIAGYLPRKRS
ncbi:MAG: hypothetical protein ACREBF_03965 [Candidatus Micrarchaeales archaeon]